MPLEISREKFDESLDVLTALLSREEVSWDGKYYKFDKLTVMPPPATPGGPPILMAAVTPEAIYHCAKRGFHIQTTPLAGDHQLMLDQVEAFRRGKAEAGEAGRDMTLSLSRVAFLAKDEADRQEKLRQAHDYYSRFDNLRSGPGLVEGGMIAPLPRKQTLEELDESLMICTASEMIDKLGPYAEGGIDRMILNINFGASQADTLDSLERFATEVMPHFTKPALGHGRRRSKEWPSTAPIRSRAAARPSSWSTASARGAAPGSP